MTVVAEFLISGPGVALADALARVPGMTLTLERSQVDDGVVTHFLWATGDDFEAFEAGLAEDPTAESFSVVDDRDDRRLYRVTIPLSAGPDLSYLEQETGASRLSIKVSADGVRRRMRFPDHEAMGAYFEGVRDHDLTVTLQRVVDGPDRGPAERYGLSAKQERTLRHALANGYFAVPRETDLSAVADDLGISTQAASERLRRGVATLLRNTIETDGLPEDGAGGDATGEETE